MSRSTEATVRILGIPVSIGPGIVIGLLALGLLSRLSGVSLVEWVVFGLVGLLLHELGHAVAFRRFGVASSITFWWLGGYTMPTDQEAVGRLLDRQMLVVALAGPAVGLVLGLAGLAAGIALGGAARSIRFPIYLWTFVNLGWGVFNLLPIAALDGGRALRSLAGALFGRVGRVLAFGGCMAASVLIAVAAFQYGLITVSIVAVVFGLLNPAAYSQLMDDLRPGRSETPAGSSARPSADASPAADTASPGPRA